MQGCALTGAGIPSVGADSFVLWAERSVPNQPGLFFQGDNTSITGWPWQDGLRCAGSNVVRIEARTADGNGSAATSVAIGRKGGVTPGDTKYYQWWYRDPIGSPCGYGSNLSNGVEVYWAP